MPVCALVAVVDTYEDTAQTVAERLQPHQQDRIHAFRSVEALLEARLTDAAVVASRTDAHVRDALELDPIRPPGPARETFE